MKYDELMRQVVMETALFIGVLLLMVGGIYYIGVIRSDYETQAGVLRREAALLQQEADELQLKFFKVRKNALLYQQATEKQQQGRLTISRQVARDTFNRYNDEYFLGNLRLTMSGIEELNDPRFRRPHGSIVASDVNVNFEAISDEYVYEMMNAMQEQMSGSVRITRLSLSRQRGISPDILRVISQKGAFPLVVGEIRFTWLGIKPIETGESNVAPSLR